MGDGALSGHLVTIGHEKGNYFRTGGRKSNESALSRAICGRKPS
jgi:hypothetical protein